MRQRMHCSDYENMVQNIKVTCVSEFYCVLAWKSCVIWFLTFTDFNVNTTCKILFAACIFLVQSVNNESVLYTSVCLLQLLAPLNIVKFKIWVVPTICILLFHLVLYMCETLIVQAQLKYCHTFHWKCFSEKDFIVKLT